MTLRALRYTGIAGVCIAEPVIFPYEYVCLGYVGHIRSGRLYSMHKAAARIHADMRLVSDMPVLPFLGLVRFKGRAHGPCSSLSFKAQVKVASTIEPPRIMIPAFSSSEFRS